MLKLSYRYLKWEFYSLQERVKVELKSETADLVYKNTKKKEVFYNIFELMISSSKSIFFLNHFHEHIQYEYEYLSTLLTDLI